MIYFSTLATRPVLHEMLIVVFITLTTPVTLMILVPAALLRDRPKNNEDAAQNSDRSSTRPTTNDLRAR